MNHYNQFMTEKRYQRAITYQTTLLKESLLDFLGIEYENPRLFLKEILEGKIPLDENIQKWLHNGKHVKLMSNLVRHHDDDCVVVLNDDMLLLEEFVQLAHLYGPVSIKTTQPQITEKWLMHCGSLLNKNFEAPENFVEDKDFYNLGIRYPKLLKYKKVLCPNAPYDERLHGFALLKEGETVVFSSSEVVRDLLLNAIETHEAKALNFERICREYLTEEDIVFIFNHSFSTLLTENYCIDGFFNYFTEEQKALYWWNVILNAYGQHPDVRNLAINMPEKVQKWSRFQEFEAIRAMGVFDTFCDKSHIFKIFYTQKMESLEKMKYFIRHQNQEVTHETSLLC